MNIPVFKVNYQTCFGLTLDSKLIFDMHIKAILANVKKTIGLQQKFHRILLESFLSPSTNILQELI